MKKNFINFISVALVITGLLVTADGMAKKMWDKYNLQSGMAVVLLFLFLYALLHWYLLKIGSREPKKFVNAFMAVVGIKMLVLLGFLGIFVYTRPQEKIAFLVLFLAAYMLHTINEIFWANKFVRSVAASETKS